MLNTDGFGYVGQTDGSGEFVFVRLKSWLVLAAVVCFGSAAAVPFVLYFRTRALPTGRVAVAFVGACVFLALAWMAMAMLREKQIASIRVERSPSITLPLGIGFVLTVLGAWLMLSGAWAALILVGIGSGPVIYALRTLRGTLETDKSAEAGRALRWNAELRKSRLARRASPEDTGDGVAKQLDPRVIVFLVVGVLCFVVMVTTLATVSMGGLAQTAVVFIAIDLVMALAVSGRFWRRSSSGNYVDKQEDVRRFSWLWFEKGFLATVTAEAAALLFVQWLRGYAHWGESLAAFVAATGFVVLAYEALRQLVWVRMMPTLYPRVPHCSHCDASVESPIAIRCSRCGSPFKFELN